jgi:hypothetical protein
MTSSSRVQARTTSPQLSPPLEFNSTLGITARLSVTPVFPFPPATTPFLETVETALKEPMGRRLIQVKPSHDHSTFTDSSALHNDPLPRTSFFVVLVCKWLKFPISSQHASGSVNLGGNVGGAPPVILLTSVPVPSPTLMLCPTPSSVWLHLYERFQRPETPLPMVNQYESDSCGEGVPESGIGTDGGGRIPSNALTHSRPESLDLV